MNVYAKVWQGASCTFGNARILDDFHQVVQILIRVDICHACGNVWSTIFN